MTDRSVQLLQRGYRLQEDNVTEPRTEAGRAFDERLTRAGLMDVRDAILEIERQSATLALADVAELTVERLARAAHTAACDCPGDDRPGCHLRQYSAEHGARRILAALRETSR